MLKRGFGACVALLLALSVFPATAQDVRIGVLAKRGEQRALEQWSPTAGYLDRRLPEHRFTIVPLAFREIFAAAEDGSVDFVLANPAMYVELETDYRAGRIVTLRNRGPRGEAYTRFGGVVFTSAGREDIDSLAGLSGKRFAAVDKDSFGGFLTAMRELHRRGISPGDFRELRFLGTHDAVVRAVLAGEVAAGTVRTDTLERMAAEGAIRMEQVKVLTPKRYEDFGFVASTRLYPEWPLAKLRHTSDALADGVASALLDMPADSPAALAAQSAGWTVPLNYQPVHALMHELRIGPYEDVGRITPEQLAREYWPWLLGAAALMLLLAGANGYVTALNRRLTRTELALRDARDNLAERIRERTADLEESRRQLEVVYRDWNDAFDAIEDPIFIHDRELRIVRANPAYARRAGMTPEEVIGRLYWEVFPKMDGPLASCREFPEHMHEPEEIALGSREVFLSRSFGIRGPDGAYRNAIHILEDVTAERRAERRRRTLSLAVEQAREAVVLLNAERKVVFSNPAFGRLFETSDEELSGVSLDDLVDDLAPALEAVRRASERGGGWAGELELVTPSGRQLPAFLSVSAIRDEQSVLTGYAVTVMDMTEVAEAERALQYRMALEAIIGSIAAEFLAIESARLNDELDRSVRRLGQFLGTDRAYTCRLDANHDTIEQMHEWYRPGVSAKREAMLGMSLGECPWIVQRLLAFQEVHIPDVDAMPDEAAHDQTILRRHDVRSALILPLQKGDELRGFLGFDSVHETRTWPAEDIRLLRTAAEIIASGIARHEAEDAVRHSENTLAEAQRIARLGNWEWNIQTGELAWSDEIYLIFGLRPGEFGASYEAFLSYIHPDDRDMVKEAVDRAVARHEPYDIDHRIMTADGTERIVHETGKVEYDGDGRAVRMVGTVQDVTEARRADAELKRLNRALLALSRGNTVLVHAEDEMQLLGDVCRVLVETGGYRLAWVGYPREDEEKSIVPVAWAGSAAGYLDTVRMSWGESELGRGPTGTAIRTVKPVVARDVETDPAFAPWRDQAAGWGFASVYALPLVAEGELIGALTIDAGERDAFDERERDLLNELAADLAFGIRALRNRADRSRARAALAQSERRYRDLFNTAPIGYASAKADSGQILQCNPAFADLLGLRRKEVLHRNLMAFFSDADEGVRRAREVWQRFSAGEGVGDVELQMRRADGEPVWVSLTVEPVVGEEGKITEGRINVIDISQRKAAEAERLRFVRELERSLMQTIQAIAATIEKRDPYTAGHQQRVAELATAIAERMHLSRERTEALRLAAMIHDTGKIYVPTEILNRPGKLDEAQYTLLKSHPQVGYDILKGIDFPWPLADIVVQHHERLNGSGYPRGLKDGEIRLESRILAVADVVEAIASHRPYRPAYPVEVALNEIEQHKGDLFDPEVVDVCARLFREEGFKWTQEAGR